MQWTPYAWPRYSAPVPYTGDHTPDCTIHIHTCAHSMMLAARVIDTTSTSLLEAVRVPLMSVMGLIGL